MTQVVLPNTLTPGTPENVAHVQANDEALRDAINGTLGADNTGTGAAGLAQGTFYAYRNAAFTASGVQEELITLDAEVFDVSAWFNATTGRFTPLVAGYYSFSWMVSAGATSTATLVSSVRKNNVLYAVGSRSDGDATYSAKSGGAVVAVANGATDYFTLHITPSVATVIAVSSPYTFLCGELVGRS